MRKTVLMLSVHFPPCATSTGPARVLGFAKYLPAFGWDPIVLAASPCAYERLDPDSVRSIPKGCRVFRALALDAKRHLSIRGKYPAMLARPDRWANWRLTATWYGLYLVKRYAVAAIWSSCPAMTSHCVAHDLQRLTGIPWIADFRDPVASSMADKRGAAKRSQLRWEQRVAARAARSTFTTAGAARSYVECYPALANADRVAVVPNGYDEDVLSALPGGRAEPPMGRPLVLLHSGLLYPDGRNPVPFFTALARLKAAGQVNAGSVRIVLRASGSEAVHAREIRRLGVADLVTLAPRISKSEALVEQARADGLLLFQGVKYDQQIPAKVYEYLRIGRPIFALVGSAGETAALLRETAGARLVPLDDASAIEAAFLQFIVELRGGMAPRPRPEIVARYSRQWSAALLAELLEQTRNSC